MLWLAPYCPNLNRKEREWRTRKRDVRGHLRPPARCARSRLRALLAAPDWAAPVNPRRRSWTPSLWYAIASGITIAGEELAEVRITNNTILHALQGVHIGQSQKDAPREDLRKDLTATIEGNTIYSRITPAVNGDAYGVYVGSCDSLYVGNNVLKKQVFESTSHLPMDGIHVSGRLGRRLIVRHNQTTDYGLGVLVNPVDPEKLPEVPLWIAAENVASVHTTDQRVQVVNNVP